MGESPTFARMESDVKISEVRVKLMDNADDRLRAFCSITFDDAFVVRDLKIIDGTSGPFVAMPSRKLTAHCPQCGCKNHLRAPHCNQCGIRLKDDLAIKDQEGRAKLYADIAHPINSECREMIQKSVIEAYEKEQRLSSQPGYVSRYDDYFESETTAEAVEPPAVTTEKEPAPEYKEKHVGSKNLRMDPAQPLSPPHKTRDNAKDTAGPGEHEFGAGIF